MSRSLNRPLFWFAWLGATLGLSLASFGVTLTWVGDAGTGWFDNVSGNTNWSGNLLPQTGDDLVFLGPSTGAIYGGALSLGGNTIALNSIRVGVAGDTDPSGPNNLGVDERNLGTNGTIQLGAGGLTINMLIGGSAYGQGGTRNVRFDTNFDITANSFIRSNLDPTLRWTNRQVLLGGTIRGGTLGSPVTLELSSPNGADGASKAILVYQEMPQFYGTLALNGTVQFLDDGAIFGAPSTTVKMAQGGVANAYIHKGHSAELVVPNDIVLDASKHTYWNNNNGGAWVFAGRITGGSTARQLRLYGPARTFVFAGPEQSFSNFVALTNDVTAIVASADPGGVAWPNVPYVSFDDGGNSVLLRGSFALAPEVRGPRRYPHRAAANRPGQRPGHSL